MDTEALIDDAVRPLFVGTAFAEHARRPSPAARRPPRRSASLLWCVPTPTFRERHPSVPEALDHQHPDGCTDLMIDVDEHGDLERVELEMLDVAPDLAGRPIADVLPEVAARIGELLGRDPGPP